MLLRIYFLLLVHPLTTAHIWTPKFYPNTIINNPIIRSRLLRKYDFNPKTWPHEAVQALMLRYSNFLPLLSLLTIHNASGQNGTFLTTELARNATFALTTTVSSISSVPATAPARTIPTSQKVAHPAPVSSMTTRSSTTRSMTLAPSIESSTTIVSVATSLIPTTTAPKTSASTNPLTFDSLFKALQLVPTFPTTTTSTTASPPTSTERAKSAEDHSSAPPSGTASTTPLPELWSTSSSTAAPVNADFFTTTPAEDLSTVTVLTGNEVTDKIVEEHFPLPADLSEWQQECPGSSLTREQSVFILDTHNQRRRELARGETPNKVGFLQPARNMYKLHWDCKMEIIVQNYVSECTPRYMNNYRLKSYSQNIIAFHEYYDGTNVTHMIESAMNTWWKQVQKNGNNDLKNRYYSKNGYYGWANMAKGKSTRMACAFQQCPDQRSVFSCLYSYKAQVEKEPVYESGEPCKIDADCSTFPGSKCIAREGLCVARPHREDSGACDICPDNKNITDATRIAALIQHNFLRSRIARGLEMNGETNSTQPPAKRMLKMEYDCFLEDYAQRWADNCVFAHSDHTERPNQGQNLYMTSFNNPEPRSLMHTAIEKWWQELEEFGIPADNILSHDMWDQKGKLVGHFTQMAWDRTFRLGCAVVSCPKMGYVVCHYGPAGNRRGHKIYQVGDPCQDDSDCPPETYCHPQEALCAIRKEEDKRFRMI